MKATLFDQSSLPKISMKRCAQGAARGAIKFKTSDSESGLQMPSRKLTQAFAAFAST
jgi:hypothetical protein